METYFATFDGKVFVPDEPVKLQPNARVRVMVEMPPYTRKEDAPIINPKERKAALDRLLEHPAHSGGVDWAEWDRSDVYP